MRHLLRLVASPAVQTLSSDVSCAIQRTPFKNSKKLNSRRIVIFQKFKNVDVFIIFYDIFRDKNTRQNHFSKKRQGIFEPNFSRY